MEKSLGELLEEQRIFDEEHFLKTAYAEMTDEERTAKVKDIVIHLISEVEELLREFPNWKSHRKVSEEVIWTNVHEELIDVFNYFLILALTCKMTPEAFFENYERKREVIYQRWRQEKSLDLPAATKIAGIDLDGCIADYVQGVITFINEKLGTSYKKEDVTEYGINGSLKIPPDLYEKLKDEYRQTGKKRDIPLIEGAKELLDSLKADGYSIVILTARPYKKYARIFGDTLDWLKSNELPYDAVLWDDNKAPRLLKEFGPDKVKFFVEDVLSNAKSIAAIGAKVYLMDTPYNQCSDLPAGISRIQSLKEITL